MVLDTGVMQQARSNGLNARVVVGIIAFLGLSIGGCADNSFTDLAVAGAPRTDPIIPTVNQSVTMTFVIKNHSGDFSPTTVAAVRIDGNQVLSIPVDPIAGGDQRQITTAFSIGTVGAHSVAVVIDPDQQTNDSSRDNNTFIFSITVGATVTN